MHIHCMTRRSLFHRNVPWPYVTHRKVPGPYGKNCQFSSQEAPHLSGRTKRDLSILGIGLVAGVAYMLTSNSWEKDVNLAYNRLLSLPRNSAVENMENVPPPVRKYVQKCQSPPLTASLHSDVVFAHQRGEFFAANQWYPFSATIMYKASNTNPGYVWNAKTTILHMPNSVLQTFLDGEGNTVTKAWGRYPMIQVEEDEPYILFWLANTVLSPSVFLQNGKKLCWKETQDLHCANALLCDGAETFDVRCYFEDEFLVSIKVESSALSAPWIATYSDYIQFSNGAFVPTRIEIGKGEGQDIRSHFKLQNFQVELL